MHDYYSTRKKGASGVSMGTWELLPRANHEIAAKLNNNATWHRQASVYRQGRGSHCHRRICNGNT